MCELTNKASAIGGGPEPSLSEASAIGDKDDNDVAVTRCVPCRRNFGA
jgi:hypothetical protein